MKKNILFLIIVGFFLIGPISTFGSAENENGSAYFDLFEYEISLLESSYVNTSLPSYDIFIQAKENGSLYPLNSYNQLLTCYRSILSNNISYEVFEKGNDSVASSFWTEVNDAYYDILQDINDINIQSLSAYEWLDLGKREINDVYSYVILASSFINDSNFDSAITSLIYASSSLHKASGFVYVAQLRNSEEYSFASEIDIINGAKYLSSETIALAESSIDFYENLGYGDYLNTSKQILNQTKHFFSNELYYVALMNAAYTSAMIDYYTHTFHFNTNYSVALNSSQNHVDYTGLIIDIIKSDSDIDAPFAESTFELAQLHLLDAQIEDTEGSAIAIARLSIQESLIAYKQAQAVLELKSTINWGAYEFVEADTAVVESDSQILQYILLIIIMFETILLVVIWMVLKGKK